jgi:hypothetical protein
VAILVGYWAFTVEELFVDECYNLGDCFDYDRRMSRLYVWDIDWIQNDFRHSVHFLLLETSYQLFHNYKVLVLASSTLLLVVSYLFAVNLGEKRLAGIVAVIVVLQSSIFHVYDTSVTYPSFWALLFVTALYLTTTKAWYLAPLPYIISVPAKAITALYLPGVLVFEFFYNRKAFYLFSVMMIAGVILLFSVSQFSIPALGGFLVIDDPHLRKLAGGFVSWMWQGFADDQITLLLLVIGGFLLFFNRKKIKNSKPVLLLVLGMILTSPVMTGMTTYSIWPYRMLPLVVLIGLMVGMVVANYNKIDLKMFLNLKR